jgi:hypothetical protein
LKTSSIGRHEREDSGERDSGYYCYNLCWAGEVETIHSAADFLVENEESDSDSSLSSLDCQ